MSAVGRWFIRCYDCCAIGAIDKDPMVPAYWQGSVVGKQWRNDARPVCECGGHFLSMGKVTGNRMIREDLRCACDGRCTHATGPNCDCQCQGANHGTGRMMRVRIDEGGVPQVLGGSKTRAEEIRAAITAATERVNGLPFAADIAAGKFVSDQAAWERVRDARHQLRRIKTYKTHSKRLEAAARVAA